MARVTYNIQVHLDSYIAHPYWPERERLINIVKESGMSRARSSANRRKALEEYLKSNNMTYAEYEELEKRANRQFYTAGEWIIVPELHVTSMLVNASMQMRAAGRPAAPEQIRSLIRFSDWRTDRHKPDGVWERFAVVTSGTGAKLSNQRALRTNEYIGTPPGEDTRSGVPAIGKVTIEDSMVKPEVLREAISYAGTYIGIGACRKMGWGRFRVVNFEQAS
jgi:hypothetical protein